MRAHCTWFHRRDLVSNQNDEQKERKKDRERRDVSMNTLNHMTRYKLQNLQKIKYCKNAVDGENEQFVAYINRKSLDCLTHAVAIHRILTDFTIFHNVQFTQ